MTVLKDPESRAVAGVAIVVVIAIAFYVGAAIIFDWGISGKPSSWGPFGDYVGGIMNPAIAMAALYVLFKMSGHQKAEFNATRTHLETEAKKDEIYRVISHIDRKLELMLSIDVHQKMDKFHNLFERGPGLLSVGGDGPKRILGPLNDYLVKNWRRRGEVYVLLGDSENETPLANYLPQIRANIERLEKYLADYENIQGNESAAVSSYFEDVYTPLKAACIEAEKALAKEAQSRKEREKKQAEEEERYKAAANPEEAPDDEELKPEE